MTNPNRGPLNEDELQELAGSLEKALVGMLEGRELTFQHNGEGWTATALEGKIYCLRAGCSGSTGDDGNDAWVKEIWLE